MKPFPTATCPHCQGVLNAFGNATVCPHCWKILPSIGGPAQPPGRNPLMNKFVWLGLAGTALCLGLVAFWITRTPTHTVLFLESANGDKIRVSCVGQLEFRLNDSGQFEPYYWKTGNVIVLRSDQRLRDVSGLAGHAYLVKKGERVHDLGPVDLGKTNEQIAASFGVKSEKPPK